MSAPKYTNKLQGKRVLILGASSGVGFAVAEAALEYGASVIVSSSSETKLSRAIDRLRQTLSSSEDASERVKGKTADLASPTAVEENLRALFNFATQDGKHLLDHVVFTAGDAIDTTHVSKTSPERITKIMAVRFTAPVIVAKLLPEFVKDSHESSYTLTGGSNTDKPSPGWAVVAGVGGGVEGLGRGLAVDLKPVRVNVISLGAIKTELLDGVPEQVLERMAKGTLVGRVGTPQDAAEAYLYAMRDSFLTGSVVHTNGGRLLA